MTKHLLRNLHALQVVEHWERAIKKIMMLDENLLKAVCRVGE